MSEAAPRDWTIRDIVGWMTDDLRKRGVESARLDAELVVAQAIALDRIQIIIQSERLLSAGELDAIRTLFKRRRTLEPVAYLRGYRASPATHRLPGYDPESPSLRDPPEASGGLPRVLTLEYPYLGLNNLRWTLEWGLYVAQLLQRRLVLPEGYK